MDDEDDIYSREARQSHTRRGQAIQLLQIDILRQSLPPGLESETSRDYVLPDRLQPLVHTYDRRHYGGWEGRSLPRDGEVFSFWGARYMIAPSSISDGGHGLFIAQDLQVPPNSEVTLMCFCGPIYEWGRWHQLVRYILSMSTYGMWLNAASLSDRGITHAQGQRLYVDGRPYTQGNIAGLINSSRGRSARTNCTFVECENGHEPGYMSRDVPRYILVNATRSLRAGDELLANYGFRRPQRASPPLD